MKVDIERLRTSEPAPEPERVVRCVSEHELSALVAVVDAALAVTTDPGPEQDALLAALEPFTPPPDRAWEEVDRWNAERDLAVKAAVDATKPNPRDRARDQLADAGVVVQRQFRSDQERIAELEFDVRELERECDLRAAESASANELITEIKDRAAMQERDEPDEQERKHLWTLHESVRSAKRRALPTTTVGVWALEALLKRVDGSKP